MGGPSTASYRLLFIFFNIKFFPYTRNKVSKAEGATNRGVALPWHSNSQLYNWEQAYQDSSSSF